MILHWVAPLLEQAGRVGKTQKSWSIQAPTTHLQPPHLTPHPHHSPTLQPPSLNCQYQHVSVLKCISGERVDWSTCSNFYADFTHMQVEHVIKQSPGGLNCQSHFPAFYFMASLRKIQITPERQINIYLNIPCKNKNILHQ